MKVKLHHPFILVVTVLFKRLSVSSLQVQLTERVMFGIPVVVQVDSQSQWPTHTANITVPSLEEGKFVHFHVKADKKNNEKNNASLPQFAQWTWRAL